MEWWVVLSFFFGGVVLILLSGFPVAFAFLALDLLGVWIFMGSAGFENIALHIFTSLSSFVLAPVPLFILMGEVMYHSRLADNTLDVLDRWIGKVPGRLGVLAAVSGVIFAATSGSSMANTAMLGTVLLPEMRKRGYSVGMSVGPILGSGGLAILIPPSALAVVLASIAQISVGKLLMGGVMPGILLGVMFCAYIVLTAIFKPSVAPAYPVSDSSLGEKLFLTVKHILPVALIIFSVIGFIVLGLATPTEAAASGAIATVLVSIAYGRLTKKMIMASLKGTVEISVMVFMIIAASKTFSSVLAYTGASSGLTNLVQGTSLHPMLVLIAHDGHRGHSGMLHGRRVHHDDLPARLHAHCDASRLRPRLVRRPVPDQHRTRAAHAAFRDAPVRHEGGRPAGCEDGGDHLGRRPLHALRYPGDGDDHDLAEYRPLAA